MVNFGPGNANLQSKIFFIWAGFCLICAFFVWGLIYETKGLSLEQVDELYAKVPHAWNSPGFVPTVSFAEVQQFASSAGKGGDGVDGRDAAGRDMRRAMSLADVEQDAIRRKSVHGNASAIANTNANAGHEVPLSKEEF